MLHLPGGCDVMLYEPRHPIAADIKRAGNEEAAKKSVRLRQEG